MSDSVIPGTVARQAPLSMGFSRQEHWVCNCSLLQGNLPKSGIKLRSPALQADSLPSEPPGKPHSETGVAAVRWQGERREDDEAGPLRSCEHPGPSAAPALSIGGSPVLCGTPWGAPFPSTRFPPRWGSIPPGPSAETGPGLPEPG